MSAIEIVQLLHISAGAAVGAQGCGMDSQGMGRGWMLVRVRVGMAWGRPGKEEARGEMWQGQAKKRFETLTQGICQCRT